MIVEEFLRSLGLNESEIKVYLYILSHGESIAIGLFIESYLSMTSGSLSQKNLEESARGNRRFSHPVF